MRALRLLALAALPLVPLAVRAQDRFPDVPANHWAYAALARMKAEGLLVGYPDGLYRGGRPASRYELAVAMHAAYAKLKETTDALAAQMRALQTMGDAGDVAALKDAVAALQAQLNGMRRFGADLADLQRAADTFELELTQLGVDAQAMKDELRGLAVRVGALEKREDPLEIGGTIDLWAGGGHGGKNDLGLNRDGRLEGTFDKRRDASSASRAGITDDLAFLSEAAFDFRTTAESRLKIRGTVVLTNAFGRNPVDGVVTSNVGFGNQSDVFNPVTGGTPANGLFGYSEGTGDLYLQDLVLAYRARRFDLEAGRLEIKTTPWILQRIDNTLYFDNKRWDDGKYTYDGAKVATRLGPVSVLAYGGVDQELSANGVRIDTLRSGPVGGLYLPFNPGARLEADRLVGGTLATSVRGLGLRGDYLVLDADDETNTSAGLLDQLQVYGGEGDFRVGRFAVSGGLRHTTAFDGDARLDGASGNAWDAKVGWASGRFDLSAQYREVQTNYLAPGDWARLGVLRNPTNVRGAIGRAKIARAPRLDLGLEGEITHGLSNRGQTGTFLRRGTDVGRYAIRLDARLGRGWSGTAYYEQTLFNDLGRDATIGAAGADLPDARYQWYGVGVSRGLGGNARFSLLYEQSAIRNDYQSTGGGGADFRGGFLTSQVTVRF